MSEQRRMLVLGLPVLEPEPPSLAREPVDTPSAAPVQVPSALPGAEGCVGDPPLPTSVGAEPVAPTAPDLPAARRADQTGPIGVPGWPGEPGVSGGGPSPEAAPEVGGHGSPIPPPDAGTAFDGLAPLEGLIEPARGGQAVLPSADARASAPPEVPAAGPPEPLAAGSPVSEDQAADPPCQVPEVGAFIGASARRRRRFGH